MPLSESSSPRSLKHTRTTTVASYRRADGLWEIDAHLTDIKTADAKLETGIRVAGDPIHDLWLRVTYSPDFTIVDAQAASDAVPYPGTCNTITPDYKKLIGLNLLRGFRFGLKERLSGSAGCTHLTELAQVLPTVAVQGFSGELFAKPDGSLNGAEEGAKDGANKSQDNSAPTQQPFQLGRCHALRTDGPVVATYYPRWAAQKPTGTS